MGCLAAAIIPDSDGEDTVKTRLPEDPEGVSPKCLISNRFCSLTGYSGPLAMRHWITSFLLVAHVDSYSPLAPS